MPSRPDENLDQTFEAIFELLRSERFLDRCGPGSDLPFFISAFHPALQPRVDALVPALAKRLSNQGTSVLLLDLYDLTVELLKNRNVDPVTNSNAWTRLLEKEASEPRDRYLKTMQSVADAETHLVPLIGHKLAASSCQILLLTGVGLVFPFLRSHQVLDNLQKVTKRTPTVLFFPGDYTHVDGKGSQLKLFGTLPDDRYYRAFNIADFLA